MGDTPWVFFRKTLKNLDIYYGRLTLNEFYDHCFPDARKTCIECNAPCQFLAFGVDARYREFCSTRCRGLNVNLKERTIQTKRNNGTISYLETEEGKERFRQTCLKKFGVPYPLMAKPAQKKRTRTFQERYGVSHYSKTKDFKTKYRETARSKYGVDHPMQSEETVKKLRSTSRDRYGVPYYSMTGKGFKRTKVKDGFGRVHMVQGYEPRAIEVLSRLQNVQEIVSGSEALPIIPYTAKDGKTHRYFPDLLVRTSLSEHLIEVKSSWTLRSYDGGMTTIRKAEAATKFMKKRGGHYWILVFGHNVLTRLKDPTASDIKRLLAKG